MEIITTATAATAAKGNTNANQNMANASYSKSLMASRALQSNGVNNEVNITQLTKGDVFKGEITNMTGRMVTVSLGNGQVLSATLMENVPINIGNSLYFEVKENDGERITIRPLLDEKFSPQNQTIEKSLQSAGLQVNEKNMAVVKELMDASMPIDRGSIMKILQQLVNYPKASISTIVSMVRCDIPITQENLNQFEQYQQHSGQLNSQMDSVINSITTVFESLGGEEMFAGECIRFNQVIVDTFTTTKLEQPLPALLLQDAFVMEEGEIEGYFNRMDLMETDKEGQVVTDGNGNALPKGSVQMNEAGMPVLDKNGNYVFSENFVQQVLTENPELTREAVLTALRNGEYSLKGTSAFTNEIQSAFAEQLKTLGISEDAVKVMLDPNNTAEDLMKAIQDYVKHDSSLSDSAIKQFFSSREYTVLVESVAENHWKLTPEQVKSPEKVEQLFQRLAEQSSKLAMAGGSFSSAGEQMGQQAQNMNENLQFMEALNQKYTYAQIPLQLSNQDANSELYVYTNKKTLAKDKKDISVLLHLDMEHLGSTDVHVQMNGGQVSARFYLEDNRSMSTVKAHMAQLQEQIAGLGLNLTMEVVKRIDKKAEVEDIVEDFLAKDIPSSQQIKRYTFDMRA